MLPAPQIRAEAPSCPWCSGSARLLPCCTQGFATRAHAECFLARGDGAVRKTATTKDMIVLPCVSKSLLGALVPVSRAPRVWTCRWTSGTDTWVAAHGGHQEPSARKPPLARGNTEIEITSRHPLKHSKPLPSRDLGPSHGRAASPAPAALPGLGQPPSNA